MEQLSRLRALEIWSISLILIGIGAILFPGLHRIVGTLGQQTSLWTPAISSGLAFVLCSGVIVAIASIVSQTVQDTPDADIHLEDKPDDEGLSDRLLADIHDLLKIRLSEFDKTYDILERQLAHANDESNVVTADMIRKITAIDGLLQGAFDTEAAVGERTHKATPEMAHSLDDLIGSVQTVAEDMNIFSLSVANSANLPDDIKGQAAAIAKSVHGLSETVAGIAGPIQENLSDALSALESDDEGAIVQRQETAGAALQKVVDQKAVFESRVQETIHELLSLTQHQDISRQRINAVGQTIRLLQETNTKIINAVQSGDPVSGLMDAQITTDHILSFYTMESQRQIHGAPDDKPAQAAAVNEIELF